MHLFLDILLPFPIKKTKLIGPFKQLSLIDGYCIFHYIALMRLVLQLTNDKSSLVQVMAWCNLGTKPLPEPKVTLIYVALSCN